MSHPECKSFYWAWTCKLTCGDVPEKIRPDTHKITVLYWTHLLGFLVIPFIFEIYLVSNGLSDVSNHMVMMVYAGIGSNILAIGLAITLYVQTLEYHTRIKIMLYGHDSLGFLLAFVLLSIISGFVLVLKPNVYLLLSLGCSSLYCWIRHVWAFHAALALIAQRLTKIAKRNCPVRNHIYFTHPHIPSPINSGVGHYPIIDSELGSEPFGTVSLAEDIRDAGTERTESEIEMCDKISLIDHREELELEEP